MTPHIISDSQKDVLRSAVDSGDPGFIARCVYNIEEILIEVKSLLSEQEYDVTEPNTSDNLEIKEEPIEPDDALVALTEDRELSHFVADASQPGCPSPGPEAIPVDHFQCINDIPEFNPSLDNSSADSLPYCPVHNSMDESTDDEVASNPSPPPTQSQLPAPPTHTLELTPVHSVKRRRRKVPTQADEKGWICAREGCDFVTDKKKELREHQVLAHPMEPLKVYRCGLCDFEAVKKANFKQHQKTHLAPEKKQFKCDLCSYSSNNKEGLEMHDNSVHKGVRPFLCDLCGKSFTGSSMLSKHKLMKHKPKHLKCPHCDYSTAVLTWLKDHMRKHSQDTPFQCTHCSYTAKSAGRLKVHIRIHTGEKPYKCHLCDYGATEGAPLKKHLKNQHSMSVSRIDIRNGKLFLEDGSFIDTGLGTTTAPLPPDVYQKSTKVSVPLIVEGTGMENQPPHVITVMAQPMVTQMKPINIALPEPLPATAEGAANIIAQAASLSALPVHPESPPPAHPSISGIRATPVESADTLRTIGLRSPHPVYTQLMVPTSAYQSMDTQDILRRSLPQFPRTAEDQTSNKPQL